VAKGVNPTTIIISINRSPCSSTDWCHNGAVTCNKGGGAAGCAERLIALKGAMPATTIKVDYRDIYGVNAKEEANSASANAAMVAAGIIMDTHQLGGPDEQKFRHTGAAKKL